MQETSSIHTTIWDEAPVSVASEQNIFARCHGYDVYGQLVGRCSLTQMLYLLFRGECPTETQVRMLDALSVALINPGPRDTSVHAAMSAGVAGSVPASWLMVALSVGAGRHGGSTDVRECMQLWTQLGPDVLSWQQALVPRPAKHIWPACEYPAGHVRVGVNTGPTVLATLETLCRIGGVSAVALRWLQAHHEALSEGLEGAMGFSFVAAMALTDLGFTAEEGELMYLMLRLPGAAVHALEQSQRGHRAFPFPQAEKLPTRGALYGA
jgi:citrate synthase